MPTITVSRGTLKALGVASDDLLYHLTTEQKRLLEALLLGHQFNISAAISVVVLASGEGVVLAQRSGRRPGAVDEGSVGAPSQWYA
jgi:hypothetical protein